MSSELIVTQEILDEVKIKPLTRTESNKLKEKNRIAKKKKLPLSRLTLHDLINSYNKDIFKIFIQLEEKDSAVQISAVMRFESLKNNPVARVYKNLGTVNGAVDEVVAVYGKLLHVFISTVLESGEVFENLKVKSLKVIIKGSNPTITKRMVKKLNLKKRTDELKDIDSSLDIIKKDKKIHVDLEFIGLD